jgi:hypothetical protein
MPGRPKSEAPSPRVRITNQFRRRDAMVYDLSCEELRLTVTMTSRANLDGPDDWLVEAFVRESAERPVVVEPGPSREDALRAVACSWAAKNRAHGFPHLDWEAVVGALRSVRAV